jgi:hypothetical protein
MAALDRHERFVVPARLRVAGVVYVLLTLPVAAALGARAHGQSSYLTVWALVALFYVPFAVVAAPGALRRVDARDRRLWRLWCAGWCIAYSSGPLVYLAGRPDGHFVRALLPVAALAGMAVFGTANTAALRGQAGQRALVVDIVDLLTAVVATVGPVALLVGAAVVGSENRWLTVPAALVAVGLVHACITLLLLYMRAHPDRRSVVLGPLGFCLVALVDAGAQVAQGVDGFTLPSAPLVAVHALCMGGGLLLVLFTIRRTSTGLDRLPPQRQVRKSGPLAAVVLSAMAVIGLEALVRRDRPWVLVGAMALVMALLVLSTIRQLLLARETARLYGEVERAADERRELLSEMLRSVDSDRHHAAIQLHQQAASLYTAMASFARAIDWLPGDEVPPAVGLAAERVRFDLARRVDASQQILTAIGPAAAPDRAGLPRLVALTRAYVGDLWGDVRRPELGITVDDQLAIDWAHEAVVFRIVQVALDNIRHHADASSIQVAMTAPDDALTVVVSDDGVGFEPGTVVVGSGIATMQALAGYVDGHVDIDSAPGAGTRIHAVVGRPTPPAPSRRRPHLRVV